jgi:hypothetical protein
MENNLLVFFINTIIQNVKIKIRSEIFKIYEKFKLFSRYYIITVKKCQ